MNENRLMLLLLAGSFIVHVGMGWFCLAKETDPILLNRKAGRTSVAIQIVANVQPVVPQSIESDPSIVKELAKPTPPPELPEIFHRKAAADDLDPVEIPISPSKRRESVEPIQQPKTSPPKIKRSEQQAKVPQTSKDVVAVHKIRQNVLSQESTGADVPPSFRTRVDPKYPRKLLLAGVEAVVELNVTVGKTGRVVNAEVHKTSGHKSMDDSALDAIGRWSFVPAKRNGRPINKQVIIPVRFRIRR